tara:strand:- start:400 stop:714 length:315 start_codon:yes stop_codon:yes gene_type:complete
MIEELMDELIFQYTRDKKKVEPLKKEIDMFMQFYLQFLEGLQDDKHKYIQYKTLGLALIDQNKTQFYRRIREGIRIVHHRSTNYKGIVSSKTFGSRRGRSRRLV